MPLARCSLQLHFLPRSAARKTCLHQCAALQDPSCKIDEDVGKKLQELRARESMGTGAASVRQGREEQWRGRGGGHDGGGNVSQAVG